MGLWSWVRGCSLGSSWAGASCMPQACPKPLGWQPHQPMMELAPSLGEGESWKRSGNILWPGTLMLVRLKLPCKLLWFLQWGRHIQILGAAINPANWAVKHCAKLSTVFH